MDSQSGQTDKIIDADNTQASSASQIADASSKSAKAAENFSESAAGINKQTKTSVERLRDLGQATQQAADISRDALIKVQRAFLSVDYQGFQIAESEQSPNIIGMKVIPRIINDSNTPAVDVTYHFNACTNDIIPENWPDMDRTGNLVLEPNPSRVFYPPRSNTFIHDQWCNVTPTSHKFSSGWIKYRDVFDGEHITQFCYELNIVRSIPPSTMLIYTPCPHRNCIDEYCKKKH